ncbi:hypothetical protein GDO81_029246 [Engystomops pustulosus]|uniref:Uncharacterized protein n=1 Tax=Engystomops pustulosus TaxID=76066 RepID=A0AAV6ZNZ0_ENGPU|nr:hypothetical protein GDO81_029246 [Engystomops pustulosus]
MDKDEISRRIFSLALEIISLLSGEDYTLVKKTSDAPVTPSSHLQEPGGEGWSRTRGPIREPPLLSLIHEQRILELTMKMTVLLTGEVSGCGCVFLHGGAGVYRGTQGPVPGRHDGGPPALHITRWNH